MNANTLWIQTQRFIIPSTDGLSLSEGTGQMTIGEARERARRARAQADALNRAAETLDAIVHRTLCEALEAELS